MNWEAVGAIGEVVGATAVVVSLIYLATQVLVSNRLARAEAWRVPNSDLNTINAAFSTDIVFRSAMNKAFFGKSERDGLSPDEQIIFDMYIISLMNIYEQIYREIREGTLKEESIQDFGARSILEMPYFRDSWPQYTRSLGPSFVRYFEENLLQVSRRVDT